ncbi:MAG: DUF3349 domain-containing protein [Actinobacteria bacterium]|nr:MAG: DUF3349 domain-containing protein [Actinomycetota bacterium]
MKRWGWVNDGDFAAPLVEVLGILRRAYPDEFPKEDYYPLLAVLQTDMSEENLSNVVAEFLDDETVVIANDAAKAASVSVPKREDFHPNAQPIGSCRLAP